MTKAIIFVIFYVYLCLADQLLFVQQTIRHGARYPIYPKQIDNTMYAVNQNKVGQLTLEGKKMHYLLGKAIFDLYSTDLKIPGTLDESFFLVKSTNVNRTIQSAQSHLLGLLQTITNPDISDSNVLPFTLPAWSDSNFTSDLGPIYPNIDLKTYKSFPIHTQYKGSDQLNPGDFLYMFSYSNCPNQQVWENQNYGSDLTKSILNNQKVNDSIQFMTKTLNFTSIDLETVQQIIDNYICSLYLGKPIVDTLFNNSNPQTNYMRQYKFLYFVIQLIQSSFTKLQTNSTITPYFNQTINNMNKIIQNPTTTIQKFILYSTHDLQLINILVAMNMTSAQCVYDLYLKNATDQKCVNDYPGFASSIIYELWRSSTNQFYVKVRYLGNYREIPFCNYSYTCNYDDFKKYLNATIRPTYLQDCGVAKLPVEPAQSKTGLIVGVAITGAVFLAITIYEIIKIVKKIKQRAQPRANNDL